METYVALCGVGVERVTANELRKLGLSVEDTGFGRVRFKADTRGCYRALMGLRTADRVLWEAARFPAADFDALFGGIRDAPWERFIPRGMGLKVDKVRSNRSQLRGITSIQGMAHKAAAERLCGKYRVSRLPEQGPAAEIRVYLEKDEAQALLDLSGEPLFKRGYRTEGGIAPLRETTAASLLFLANWRRKFPLCDPLCGSGTIVIEAALYAWDAAPGMGRNFAFEGMLGADRQIEREVREKFLAKTDFTRTIRIFGSDADPKAIAGARSNLLRAYRLARGERPRSGPESSGAGEKPALPVFETAKMDDLKAPFDGEGFIITNPPYGVRLGEPEEAEAVYRDMAVLCRIFPGWKLACITDHAGFESLFGRKAVSCREMTNGAIRSYFYQYETLRG
ncbi:MAG: class I SAM-dependent RNA methyltransferase [Spirochaetaceae bacterium]|jgi:putative N6-adenine-specific DNA methylase|nr:class I SAM-dependent RNA methyltransferase [Spirochaetaceae bacterium]